MSAVQQYKAGHLDEAIEALGAEVRDNPTDSQRRAFLFELLCFAGKFDRAEKQLMVLGTGSKDAEMGALVYHGALNAERVRQDMFASNAFPTSAAPPMVAGTLNGTSFSTIADADPRIGPRLELFAAGQYMWLPFSQIASVQMQPPRRLRDLLWAPVLVRPSDTYEGREIGEVLTPTLAPLTWQEKDGNVRLGRVTEWRAEDDVEVPIGQKLLLVDGEEFPILELRELVITSAAHA